MVGCPESPQVADCNPGYLPCDGDKSECCEVICEEGYHLCGEDLTECCMDTTNSIFHLYFDTLGNYGSYFKDVWINSIDDIWVVGEIITDSTYYGATHWDGESWNLIQLRGSGIPIPSIRPRGLWYFSEDNIWFASGSIYHWNGEETKKVWTRDLETWETIERIWAVDDNQIYFAGNEGLIIFWDGNGFNQLYAGTDKNIVDISGSENGEHIFFITLNNIAENTVFEYNDGIFTTVYETNQYIPTDTTFGNIISSSVYGDTVYFASKRGLVKYNYIDSSFVLVDLEESKLQGQDYKRSIAQSPKDIAFLGSTMHIVHYNGSRFTINNQMSQQFDQISFLGGDFKNDIVSLVGSANYGQFALIAIGIRF